MVFLIHTELRFNRCETTKTKFKSKLREKNRRSDAAASAQTAQRLVALCAFEKIREWRQTNTQGTTIGWKEKRGSSDQKMVPRHGFADHSTWNPQELTCAPHWRENSYTEDWVDTEPSVGPLEETYPSVLGTEPRRFDSQLVSLFPARSVNLCVCYLRRKPTATVTKLYTRK